MLSEVEQSEREVKQKITKEHTKSRNTLDGKAPPDVRQAFERWRRGSGVLHHGDERSAHLENETIYESTKWFTLNVIIGLF